MNHAVQVFNRLHGVWRLQRTVSTMGRMTGWACFTTSALGLDYREEGDVLPDIGQQTKFYQDYKFRLGENGIAVVFTDGRPFHDLAFDPADPWTATGHHLCGHDRYDAVYRFEEKDPDRFRLSWTVRGPRKDYRLDTTFTREPTAPPELRG